MDKSKVDKSKIIKRIRFLNLQLFAEGDPPAKGGYSAEYVQELREEAASWRKKLRTAEEERDDFKSKLETANKKTSDLEGQSKALTESVCKVLGLDASKTDTDAIVVRIKEATAGNNVTVEKAQEALRKSAFIAAAVSKGIKKEALEDAYKLADFSSVKVDLEAMSVFQVDKEGKQIMKDNNPIAGLDSLVEGLAKEKPYLAGKVAGVGSSTNQGGDLSAETEGELGKQLGAHNATVQKTQIEQQGHYFK